MTPPRLIMIPPAFGTPPPACPPHPFARVLGWGIFDSPETHGHTSNEVTRLGGVAVHDTSSLLGLRPWRDTCEGMIDTSPWVIFELEKLLRMLLRQSTLATELLLAIPPHDDLPVDELLHHAITAQLPVAYAQSVRLTLHALRDETQTPPDANTLRGALRRLLSGAVLATQHRLCVHLPTLLTLHGDEALLKLDASIETPQDIEKQRDNSRHLRAHFDAILPSLAADHPRNCLPRAPIGYDALHAYLITQRLGASS